MIVGETIGHYKIVEQLGQGGMATVYRAVHLQLDVERAIKIIRPEFGADEAFQARFRQEAQAIAKLRHPNIVQLHDYGLEGDRPYMVMEFIEGQDLKSWLAEHGPARPIREIIPIIRQIADALDYAHKQGIIHRDIKPANILLQKNNQAILTDFGIAQMVQARIKLTQTGAMMGTPSYMAPEQVRSEPTTAATDIYGLGIVVYEMLTGQVPFSADTPYAVLLKVANDPLPEPRQFAEDIPLGVQNAILKATAREPQDRFATASAFVDALEQALNEGVAATVYDSSPGMAAVLVEKAPPPVKEPPVKEPVEEAVKEPLPKAAPKNSQPSSQWALILILIIAACVVLGGIIGGVFFLSSREQTADTAGQVVIVETATAPPTSPPKAAVDEAPAESAAVDAVVTEPTATPTEEAAAVVPTEALATAVSTALLGEPVLLSSNDFKADNPEVVRDKDGVLHVIWSELDVVDTVERIWHREKNEAGVWSEADLIWDEGLITNLKMALGIDGYPCVFWGTGGPDYQRCYANGTWLDRQEWPVNGRDWMPAANRDGQFTSTGIISAGTLVMGDVQVSDNGALAYQPQFTIDSSGRYHTFWIRQGDPFSLEHRWSEDNGQTWSEAQTLSTPEMTSIQTDFAIAPDSQGRVHLAFMLPGIERRVAYRVWEDGVWSETEFLTDPGAGLISLDMALDSQGQPALAWAELQMALTRQQPDGTWSAPAIILQDIQGTSLDSFKLSFATDEQLDLIWTDEGKVYSAPISSP